MKKGKQEKKVDLRNFTQPKDIIPDKLVSTLRVREPKPPKTVEPGQPDHGLANRYIQDPVFEEWPSDETIAAHDFGVTTDKVFNDPHQIPLPPSMKKTKNVLVSFKRYKEYLASLIDKNTVAVSKRGLMKQNTLTDFGDNTSFQRKTSSPRIKSRAVSMEFEADRIDLADFQCSLVLNDRYW